MSETYGDEPETGTGSSLALGRFLRAAYGGDIDAVKAAITGGVNVNAVDPANGLTALHLAVGRDQLVIVRYLVEEAHAAFLPDRRGRFPTTVAAQCEVSDDMNDYIVEKEAEYQQR
jgi:ankyrin repeat protein